MIRTYKEYCKSGNVLHSANTTKKEKNRLLKERMKFVNNNNNNNNNLCFVG
ncbi:hypothetical protein [Methanobrevibacter curvatus]|uniref:hypothetical protein n=1 Tax=Methanobrevibacter curvatus TaxID=49547 RepID=UPI0012EDB8BA|nr:hypothetical protein [Methanobrevibacter curvatus]